MEPRKAPDAPRCHHMDTLLGIPVHPPMLHHRPSVHISTLEAKGTRTRSKVVCRLFTTHQTWTSVDPPSARADASRKWRPWTQKRAVIMATRSKGIRTTPIRGQSGPIRPSPPHGDVWRVASQISREKPERPASCRSEHPSDMKLVRRHRLLNSAAILEAGLRQYSSGSNR